MYLAHGHTKNGQMSSTYVSWKAMIQRCTNRRNGRYKYYGGRGIEVCGRWRSFENFLADMGECPPGLTLNRIDGDKNYEPSNCEWATSKEQGLEKAERRGKLARQLLGL